MGDNEKNPPRGGDQFIYELGADFETKRCPLSLMKNPLTVEASELYSFYQKGLTPNGSLQNETIVYQKVMTLLENLVNGAESWYYDKLDEKKENSKGGG